LPVSDRSVPAEHRPVVMAGTLAKWTRKLGGIETFTVADVRWIQEIGQIVAGSAEAFRRNPPLVGYAETRSPLCFDRNMVEVFLEYVKLGVPQTVDTMPAGGTTAPVTGAAILALGAADTLAAMTLAYAVRDDAVVAMDINPSYADMHTGLFKYSGADRCNLLLARIQLLSDRWPTYFGKRCSRTCLNRKLGFCSAAASPCRTAPATIRRWAASRVTWPICQNPVGAPT